MSDKIDIQICFSLQGDLEKIKSQLQQLSKEGKFKFYCCFLPRAVVENENLDTTIVDMFDDVLGDNLVYALEGCSTLKECMGKMSEARIQVANKVNKMYVLDSGVAKGIQEEIRVFTQQKVVLLP